MKPIRFLTLILIMSSCTNNKHVEIRGESSFIRLPSNLNQVISNFHHQKCNQGVPSILMHSFCEGEIAEIWCTTGWSELEERKPIFYTEYKNSIFLVFNESILLFKMEMTDKEISNLVGIQLEEDVGLPPRTGFPHKWLYRLDYPKSDIYSMVDSLFKYDDDIGFNENLKTYTGNSICY